MDSCTSWALSAKSSSLNCVQQESVPSHLALHHLIALSLSVNAYITCSSPLLCILVRVFNFLFSYALLHGLLLLCSHANSRANPLHSSQAALKAFLLIILKYRLCCTLLPLQPQFRLRHVEEKTCWVKSVCFIRNLLFCCRCLPDVVSTGLVQKKRIYRKCWAEVTADKNTICTSPHVFVSTLEVNYIIITLWLEMIIVQLKFKLKRIPLMFFG